MPANQFVSITDSEKGVAILYKELYLYSLVRHIVNEFGKPSFYNLWVIDVHTDGKTNG